MKDTSAINQGDLEIVEAEELEQKHPLSHMLKGALINSVNPFTVLFWAGTASTVLVGKSNQDAFLFFLAISPPFCCLALFSPTPLILLAPPTETAAGKGTEKSSAI